MSLTIGAIYEGGVLKPDEPLELAELQRVQLTVETDPVPGECVQALEKFWRERTPIYPSGPRPTRDELNDRR